MNAQELRLRYYNLSQDIKKIWHKFRAELGNDQSHEMSDEEKLDETIEESFPASDPPGHISHSLEDKALH